jgi:hypothetical protein
MEDNTRIKVGKQGFCSKHFDMLFSRQNKLSVALQIGTRVDNIDYLFSPAKSVSQAKKFANEIQKGQKDCVICDLVEESMIKYYKTIAQMFVKEKEFYKMLISSKGFCLPHYAELLKYSSSAGFGAKEYLAVIGGVQQRNMERLSKDLKKFCDKHDYRNALEPLGSAETALPRMGEKLYGKKYD